MYQIDVSFSYCVKCSLVSLSPPPPPPPSCPSNMLTAIGGRRRDAAVRPTSEDQKCDARHVGAYYCTAVLIMVLLRTHKEDNHFCLVHLTIFCRFSVIFSSIFRVPLAPLPRNAQNLNFFSFIDYFSSAHQIALAPFPQSAQYLYVSHFSSFCISVIASGPFSS